MNMEESSSTKYEKLEDNSYYSAPNQVPLSNASHVEQLSERRKVLLKLGIFLCCTTFIVIGRFSVPDNEPFCVVDKVQNALSGVNYFILTNTAWRDGLQITCSGFMDILFLVTGAYWVLYARSSRLIITVFVFYIVRAAIQSIWESPFPSGFWWYNPGFPSLVVPYGRGSDFFFSGHIGFVTICATEWVKNKKPWMIAFSVIGGIYTSFILLSYQVHYSIDIFTGIIFAHWCYTMIDSIKEPIDNFFFGIYVLIKKMCPSKKTQDIESSKQGQE